jgi:hypothetical protein
MSSSLRGSFADIPGHAMFLKSTCPFLAGLGTRDEPIRDKSAFIFLMTEGECGVLSSFPIKASGIGFWQISFSVRLSAFIPPFPDGMISSLGSLVQNKLNISEV